MKFKVQTQTDQVLTVLKILAWLTFIGFSIQTLIHVILYLISLFNPETASIGILNFNLIELRQTNFLQYSLLTVFWVLLIVLKSIVWLMVARIITQIKIESPFTLEIAYKLEKISFLLFSIWILGYIGSAYAGWLGEMAESFQKSWNSGGFLFMAGLLYIISQIFKKGVELQSESELTV